MMHIMISDGAINEYNVKMLGKDTAWVEKILSKHGVARDDVLYLLCDDAGKTILEKKESKI